MKEIIWNWTPRVSVGPFRFGDPIDDYIDRFKLTRFHDELEKRFEFDWETYDVPGHRVQIHVKEKKIESVACYETCLFDGFNLIGATIESVVEKLGHAPNEIGEAIEIGDEFQTTAEFASIDLQLWLRPNKTVASAFCSEECIEVD